MATIISHSPSDTEALGNEWGRTAASGLVIGLSGDLGAGKTQLVKGLARGLGVPGRVHSPSFTLVNVYAGGRLTLFHLDLYRLDSARQVIDAGLEEYLSPEGVTVIEWAERWFGNELLGSAGRQLTTRTDSGGHLRVVQIETTGETERCITYEDFGA